MGGQSRIASSKKEKPTPCGGRASGENAFALDLVSIRICTNTSGVVKEMLKTSCLISPLNYQVTFRG
jgi:hypothetical protein